MRDLLPNVKPMKIRDLLQEKRDEILHLAAIHGAYNVRVFGSVARGEERADRDRSDRFD